jgi:hypothetical protein
MAVYLEVLDKKLLNLSPVLSLKGEKVTFWLERAKKSFFSSCVL